MPVEFTKRQVGGARSSFLNKKSIRNDAHCWRRFFRENPSAIGLLIGAVFVLGGSGFLGKYSYMFQASLIGFEAVEFTGTVNPIEKVPNWVALSDTERRGHFDALPSSKLMPLPEFDAQQCKDGMQWRPDNATARNLYVTYPVPHMGNYQLDCREYSGSHPGIDIKTLIGTPVRAMANGVIYKVANAPTGYGKHIVVAHVGVPDPANPQKKTTLLSGYAHLSETLVREGQKVAKGEVIGKTGDTGMATAPHLHFQIDRSDAPFFPYWPFGWNDVRAAGLNSYFEAVKRGVGMSKGKKYTINPINYMAQFERYDSQPLVVDSSAPVPTPPEDVIRVQTEPPSTDVVVDNTPATDEPLHTSAPTESPQRSIAKDDIRFITNRVYIPGQAKVVKIRVDESKLVASNGIDLSTTLRHLATVTPPRITADMVDDGIAEVAVQTDSTRTFKLVASGDFGEVKSQSLRAQVFTDIPTNHTHATAIKFLKDKGVVKGNPDGTFRPERTLNRAEAVKLILEGNDMDILAIDANFPDVDKTAWFAHYVATAVHHNIVKGYGDGKFKPGNTISYAEFLKVAILTAGFEVPDELSRDPYRDVPRDAWFAPYFEFAKTHSLLRSRRGGFAVPSQPITRGEAADVIYTLVKLK